MELEELFLLLSLQLLLLMQESLHMCFQFYNRMLIRRAEALCRVNPLRSLGTRPIATSRLAYIASSNFRRRSSRRAKHGWFALASTPNQPRYWVYPRSSNWWENCVMGFWGDEQWIANFRMSRRTFMDLVEGLQGRLQRRDTTMRRAVPVAKRVGIALWYLANTNTYREVEQQFGVGLSTVAEIIVEVCLAIEAEFFSNTICLGQDVAEVMAGFAQLGFPHCIGAMDGSHIPIRCPGGKKVSSAHRKSFSSVLLLGTVDHKGRFFNAEIRHSDKNHDDIVFEESYLCKAMDENAYIPGNPTLIVEGVSVPPIILTDGVFPMRKWLMKPYAPPHNAQERHFNHRLSQARNVVDCAFNRLKARWRCLTARLTVSPDNVTSLVSSCVVLHNICEVMGHTVPEAEGQLTATLAEFTEPQETISTSPSPEGDHPRDNMHFKEGRVVRDALSCFMMGSGGR